MLYRLKAMIPTVLMGGLCVYFGVQAFTGDRGLMGWEERQAMLEQKQQELQVARAERRDLEARAALLDDGNLSADLLEERARIMLGFADPRDYVIRVRDEEAVPAFALADRRADGEVREQGHSGQG